MSSHPALFTNRFGQYGNKEGIYSRHFMLNFPLLMGVPSEYYYLSAKNISQKFYFRSSFVLYKEFWIVLKQKNWNYCRQYMLYFTLLMEFLSADYFE